MTDVGGREDRDRLREIVRTLSFRQGGAFTLASGRTSTIYFNLKPTMLHPDGARLIGEMVARTAAELGQRYVAGLEMGAVPIVAATAAMSSVAGRPIRALFIRKAAKEHGTRSLIEGLAEGESLAGQPLLVVEDVTTTGGSALRAVAVARQAGADVRHVVTIVDREEGAREAFAETDLQLHAIFRKREFGTEG